MKHMWLMLERIQTPTEKQTKRMHKPIKTHAGCQVAISLVIINSFCYSTSATFNWFLFSFCFLLFCQCVNFPL